MARTLQDTVTLPVQPSSGDYHWPHQGTVAARLACPDPGRLKAVTEVKLSETKVVMPGE